MADSIRVISFMPRAPIDFAYAMLRDLILLSTARVIGTLGVVAMFHELSGHSPVMSRKMCFAPPLLLIRRRIPACIRACLLPQMALVVGIFRLADPDFLHLAVLVLDERWLDNLRAHRKRSACPSAGIRKLGRLSFRLLFVVATNRLVELLAGVERVQAVVENVAEVFGHADDVAAEVEQVAGPCFSCSGDDLSPRPHIWIASLRFLAQRAHVANALDILDIKALGQRADAQQYAQCGIRLAVFAKQRGPPTSLVSDVKHAAITRPR